jgi:hypothetical protein
MLCPTKNGENDELGRKWEEASIILHQYWHRLRKTKFQPEYKTDACSMEYSAPCEY